MPPLWAVCFACGSHSSFGAHRCGVGFGRAFVRPGLGWCREAVGWRPWPHRW